MADGNFDRPEKPSKGHNSESERTDRPSAEARAHSTNDSETTISRNLSLERLSDDEGELLWERVFAPNVDAFVQAYQHSKTVNPPGTNETPSWADQAVHPGVRPLLPVPPGLSRCPVCNEYRGTIDLDDESPHSRRKGDFLTVQCICDGIICPRCKKNRIHRPISNVWSERGGFGHIPYLAAMGPCRECHTKRLAEEAAREQATSGSETNKQATKENAK